MTKKINCMKKYYYFTLGLLLTLLTFNSCKEDIELVGNFKETAVIYGVLDTLESVHFIKINRAFIGPGNALEIAKIPDSSYFSSVEATVKEYILNPSNNVKTLARTWPLRDTLIYTKSSGVFYAPSEKVYYFSDNSQGKLNLNATYDLEVIIYKGTSKEFIVTGSTEMVSGISSGQKTSSSNFAFISNDGKLTNARVEVASTGNAATINASLKINIDEYSDNSLVSSPVINWNTGEAEVQKNASFSTTIQGQMFYELIRKNVSPDNATINTRRLSSISIVLTGGSTELNNYINANKPSGTLAQSKPSYTNLKINNDNNVVGIFTSRLTVIINKPFSISAQNQNQSCLEAKSRAELCLGTISGVTGTGGLFFKSNHVVDGASGGKPAKPYYLP